MEYFLIYLVRSKHYWMQCCLVVQLAGIQGNDKRDREEEEGGGGGRR